MIFVYPAAVSSSCDQKMIPAVCKAVERFFLVQLQDAFASGVIRAKQQYDPLTQLYSRIQLESKKVAPPTATTLLEASEKTKNGYVTYDVVDSVGTLKGFTNYKMNFVAPKVTSIESKDLQPLLDVCDAVLHDLHEFKSLVSTYLTYELSGSNTDEDKIIRNVLATNKKISSLVEADLKELSKACQSIGQELLKSKRSEAEAEKEKAGKYGSPVGTYKPVDYRIDLTPTAANVEVPIHFIGGPKSGSMGGKDGVMTSLTVGVKVLPMKIDNFQSVQDALLDDYFAKMSKNFYERMLRSLKKKGFTKINRLLAKIGIKNFDAADEYYKNREDFVKQNITMAPSGFVNAAAFKHSIDAPDNYNFTSAIVVFNKTDIDDSYADMFANRSAMNRLFKLGWSTFCVLDPIEETMIFISSMDGGYMHTITYQYIYNSLGVEGLFSSGSGLRSATRPFTMKTGNFMTFSKKMRSMANEQQS